VVEAEHLRVEVLEQEVLLGKVALVPPLTLLLLMLFLLVQAVAVGVVLAPAFPAPAATAKPVW
jgi:hypothetical protein